MLLLGGLVVSPAAPAPPGQDSVAVHVVRFYRANQAQTRVRAFVQVPYALLTPVGFGDTAELYYHLDVVISDSTGLELYREGWDGHAPEDLKGSGGYILETLNFMVPAGRYQLGVMLRDSATAREYRARQELDGYPRSPMLSDLLLSPEMRQVSATDTVPRSGELLIGSTMVTAAAEVLLTPLRTKVHYLFEAYGEEQSEGTMVLAVEDAAGKALVRTPPTAIDVPENGAVFKGSLDLAGLPEGSYDLHLTLEMDGQVIDRRRGFRMAGMRETLARDSIRIAAAKIADEGYFAAMNEAQLDSAEAPLLYIATDDDRPELYSQLSVQAKRNYLVRFWKGRDPTPGTPRNERREQFYLAVEYANREFGEGRRGVPGWRTDRGRVYARRGPPDDMMDRTRYGKAPPFQVWQYFSGKHRYYIFGDRTGFGVYNLLQTNDKLETSQPGWIEILTVDAVVDIQDYLGIALMQGQAGTF